MADCFTLCVRCGVPIGASEDAHQDHDVDCDRAVKGWCICDAWACSACCPDPGCTPLAERLQAAREEIRDEADTSQRLAILIEQAWCTDLEAAPA